MVVSSDLWSIQCCRHVKAPEASASHRCERLPIFSAVAIFGDGNELPALVKVKFHLLENVDARHQRPRISVCKKLPEKYVGWKLALYR